MVQQENLLTQSSFGKNIKNKKEIQQQIYSIDQRPQLSKTEFTKIFSTRAEQLSQNASFKTKEENKIPDTIGKTVIDEILFGLLNITVERLHGNGVVEKIPLNQFYIPYQYLQAKIIKKK